MEKVTQVTEVKSNFREKYIFHLLPTCYHYLQVAQCNAVNRLLVAGTTKLSLGEVSERSWRYTW